MARTGLSKLQVKAAREQLIAEGRYPSVDAVRLALGNTGSKTTIHRYLKELEAGSGAAAIRRDDTALALETMVQQLADRLHDDAEQRLSTLERDYQAALQQKDLELAELRGQVAALTARLAERPALTPQADSPSNGRRSIRDIGMGIFGNLLAATRAGRDDASPFSKLMTSGRTDILATDHLATSGLKFQ